MSIRVALVDDHKMMREGLRSLLEKYPDIEVVGEAGTGVTGMLCSASEGGRLQSCSN